MAYDDTEDAPPPAPVGQAAPALQEFQDVFTHPAAKEWAQEVTTRLNDYFQRRQIADDNAAAGQNFIQDADAFKSGLVSMVRSDPHAVHTALDIVPPTVSALIDNMPNAPEDAGDHHAAITSHMQQEIAAAAVTSAAESHEGTARALLGDQRIQDILGEDAHKSLTNYTDMQASARARDVAADQGQAAAAQEEIAHQSARNYIDALVDPNNGKPRSPPAWNQAVMADNRVPPQDKVALFDIHERLGARGDVPTDPTAVMDWVHQAARGQAGQRDLYPLIGDRMSLKDVGSLTSILLDPGVPGRRAINQLDDTIQEAARTIAPNGDIAETRALGRFVTWLLPHAQAGAVLDPHHPDWILGANGVDPGTFRARGDDLGFPTLGTTSRPSLGQIFAGDAGPPVPMTPGANPLLPPRTNEQPIGGTESGTFFQRKAKELAPGTKLSDASPPPPPPPPSKERSKTSTDTMTIRG